MKFRKNINKKCPKITNLKKRLKNISHGDVYQRENVK